MRIHPGLRLPVGEPGPGPGLPAKPASSSSARTSEALEQLGDKTFAREIAEQGERADARRQRSSRSTSAEGGAKLAEKLGYPVILKAANGGGGRGMRVVTSQKDFAASFEQAQRESLAAFGSPDVFIEKFITTASHIEVQMLGDKHGNLVHLFERDCSVQRRHQKVVEIAPAPNLDPTIRAGNVRRGARRSARRSKYENAGTVEFLVDRDTNKFYFIEVNPRIQVEHTVTEEVTGIDIVKSQILVAQGEPLCRSRNRPRPARRPCEPTASRSSAASRPKTRRTTFMPDYGRIAHYRSASGMGIRLDAGTRVLRRDGQPVLRFAAGEGHRPRPAVHRRRPADGALPAGIPRPRREDEHPVPDQADHATRRFSTASCTTRFIDETPELFTFAAAARPGHASCSRISARSIVNGNPLVKGLPKAIRREPAPVPNVDRTQPPPPGTRDKLKELGPEKFCAVDARAEAAAAHRHDVARRAPVAAGHAVAHLRPAEDRRRLRPARMPSCFRSKCGAGRRSTRRMRFLKECPWQRLADLRERDPEHPVPDAVAGHRTPSATRTIPTTSSASSCKEAADAGMDIFRIFDSLNWVPNMQVAMEAVLEDRRHLRGGHLLHRRHPRTRSGRSTT